MYDNCIISAYMIPLQSPFDRKGARGLQGLVKLSVSTEAVSNKHRMQAQIWTLYSLSPLPLGQTSLQSNSIQDMYILCVHLRGQIFIPDYFCFCSAQSWDSTSLNAHSSMFNIQTLCLNYSFLKPLSRSDTKCRWPRTNP